MGFGVWGLGFGVWGLGFGVWGLGFRVFKGYKEGPLEETLNLVPYITRIYTLYSPYIPSTPPKQPLKNP